MIKLYRAVRAPSPGPADIIGGGLIVAGGLIVSFWQGCRGFGFGGA